MLTASLISLPPETVRQMVDAQADGPHGGGGSAFERGAGLVVLVLAVVLAPLVALLLH